MNSLFAETLSDMKIKKTTMCPQVYQTDKKLEKSKTYYKEIREKNKEINKQLYDTENKCTEVIYTVRPIHEIFDDIKHNDKIEYRIYDIPGLNDSTTKEIFYKYVKDNFYKFDLQH